MDEQQQQQSATTAIVRYPATDHGILSTEAVIGKLGESADELAALRSALWSDLAPVGALEVMLADTILACYWRLRRVLVAEGGMIVEKALAAAREKGQASPAALARFDAAHIPGGRDVERIARYERLLASRLHRAIGELVAAQERRKGRGDGGE